MRRLKLLDEVHFYPFRKKLFFKWQSTFGKVDLNF